MSGAGVGETPNAAFAALSAASSELGNAGLPSGLTLPAQSCPGWLLVGPIQENKISVLSPSGLTEVQHFLEIRDDKAPLSTKTEDAEPTMGLGSRRRTRWHWQLCHCTRPATTSISGWSLPGPVFSFIKAARCCSTGFTKRTTWATACSHHPMFCTQLCTNNLLLLATKLEDL